jgi:hypothetical protein
MAFKFSCKNCGQEITTKFLQVGEKADCKNCYTKTKVPKTAEVIPDSEMVHDEPENFDDVVTTEANSGMKAIVMGALTVFKGDNLIVVRGRPDLTKPEDDVFFYKFVDELMTKGYRLLDTSFNLQRGMTATLVKPVKPVCE